MKYLKSFCTDFRFFLRANQLENLSTKNPPKIYVVDFKKLEEIKKKISDSLKKYYSENKNFSTYFFFLIQQ